MSTTTSFTYTTTTPAAFSSAVFSKGSLTTTDVPIANTLAVGTVLNKTSFEELFGTSNSTSTIGVDLKACLTKAAVETGILTNINNDLELDAQFSSISITPWDTSGARDSWFTTFFGALANIDPGINDIASGQTVHLIFTFAPPSSYNNITVGVKYTFGTVPAPAPATPP